MKGYDFSWSRPSAQVLKADGAGFVCRYLSPDPTKNLTLAEAQSYGAAGIACISNWESTATRADDGGFAGGQQDAKTALAQATAAGMPLGRPIYFSVDEDTTVGPRITSYFAGIESVLPATSIGVYGSLAIVKGCLDHGLAKWAWQTYAWSHGQWDPRAHIRQVHNGLKLGGADVDLNEGMFADFGQWTLGQVPPSPRPPAPKPIPASLTVTLQRVVGAAPDGFWGPDTERRLELVRGAALYGPSHIDVKALQQVLRVAVDGIVGPQTFAVWVRDVRQIQAALHVAVDGIWGPNTDAAFRAASPYA